MASHAAEDAPFLVSLERAASLGDRVYEVLLKAILSAKLPPGERLQPDRLARWIGVSPTPVKQALARLVGEGLVTARDGRYFVTPISEAEAAECFEGRLVCEQYAVAKGLPTASEEQIAAILRLNREHEALRLGGAAWPEVIARDRQFHAAIVALAGNSRLSAWHTSLDTFMNVLRLMTIDTSPPAAPPEIVNEEHRRIVEGIRARDVAATQAALRHHIERSCERACQRIRRAEEQRAERRRLC